METGREGGKSMRGRRESVTFGDHLMNAHGCLRLASQQPPGSDGVQGVSFDGDSSDGDSSDALHSDGDGISQPQVVGQWA